MLDEPSLVGIAVGSAEWFSIQRDLILSRPLVRDTYAGWYERMLADARSVPVAEGQVVELGSGPNFIKLLDQSVVTSDVVAGISDLVIDAQQLPFPDESLKALLLTHVFHHIPSPEAFLLEATRTLVKGGVISMVDVARTPFAQFFFSHFHPEGYHVDRQSWLLDQTEPLGGANQAMTWIVFRRDIAEFAARFPKLRLELIEYLPWFGYLCSGGLTKRNLIPRELVPVVRAVDGISRVLNGSMALHWHIRIRKV